MWDGKHTHTQMTTTTTNTTTQQPVRVTVDMTYDDYEYLFQDGMYPDPKNELEGKSGTFTFEKQTQGLTQVWKQVDGIVISGIDGAENKAVLLNRLNVEYDSLYLEPLPTLPPRTPPATKVFGFDTMMGTKVLVE
jgi:hypothetical protein